MLLVVQKGRTKRCATRPAFLHSHSLIACLIFCPRGAPTRSARHRGSRLGVNLTVQPGKLRDIQPAVIADKLGRLEFALDSISYFCKYRNMGVAQKNTEQVARYADMFSAMGTEARLRIMQLLLSAHPEGLVVGEIQEELEIPNSTLSHHLDKLRNEGLVKVARESTFLRYTANTGALQEVLQFLYAECCTRNRAVKPQDVVLICK